VAGTVDRVYLRVALGVPPGGALSPEADVSEPPLLEARGVVKSFAGKAVLSGLDLALSRGEIVGVTGENGSGKTTLLKVLAGLLRPDAGDYGLRGRFGYCPQEPLVFDRLTVSENLAFFAAAYGLDDWGPAVQELLRRFRFEGHARSLVGAVSGGTRQKLNLVLALLHDPEVLLLDEPYSGLDWETYRQFWSYARELRERGRALLVVSHLVYDRGLLDRVLDLHEGRLR
jgi:ABC-2 type transport system ATP-binding protein